MFVRFAVVVSMFSVAVGLMIFIDHAQQPEAEADPWQEVNRSEADRPRTVASARASRTIVRTVPVLPDYDYTGEQAALSEAGERVAAAREAEEARLRAEEEARKVAEDQARAVAEAAAKAAAAAAEAKVAADAADAAAAVAAREEVAAEEAPVERVEPAPAPVTSDGSAWSQLAQCESGSNPRAVNPSGKYRGAFQFSIPTWQSVGMSGDPIDHSYADQLVAAQRLQARSGWGQWPQCARKLGLL